jgi:ketosteroid isomerase-like protein/predicted ester cyclase
MKPHRLALLLAALLGLTASTTLATDDSTIRTQVIQTVQGMIAAEERFDAAAVLAVHADVPGYRWVDTDGTAYDFAGSRKVWTDFFTGCTKLKYTTLHEEVLVLAPDLAFYTWTGSADVTPKDGPRTRHELWTARYLCRRIDGAWKIIGGQESSAPGTQVAESPSAPASAEGQVRARDAAWLLATASRSLEDTLSFYDAEAITAGSVMFSAHGLDAFRAEWAKVFANPSFALTWSTERISLLDSGALACATGTWRTPGADASGPYLALWRKQVDGQWKVLVDAAWQNPPRTAPLADAAAARAAFEAYLEFWNKHDTAALARAFSPNLIYHYNGVVVGGTPADHLAAFKEFGGGFPDLVGQIDHFAFTDGIGAASTTWIGTHQGRLSGIPATGGKPVPPTGRKVTMSTNYLFRVEAGRIVELWETWDEGDIYQQLLQPEPKPAPK